MPDITKYKCAWNVVESESSAISYNKVSLSDNILVSNLYYTATCNRKEYECQTYIGSFQANIGLFQHCNNLTISNSIKNKINKEDHIPLGEKILFFQQKMCQFFL